MAASDALNRRLFHGSASGKPIEGGILRPSAGNYGKSAYATTDLEHAQAYASNVDDDEPTLFGTVYEVEPVSEAKKLATSDPYYGDPEGLRIVGVHSYVPTRQALGKR